MNFQQTGRFGEEIAVKYLKSKGYKILERNFQRKVSRFLKSEIDIVAQKNNTLCFVEVKAVKKGRFDSIERFLPSDKVNFKKKRKLIKSAEYWLAKNKVPLNSKWQIDVIAVVIDSGSKKAKISHFKNAIFDFI